MHLPLSPAEAAWWNHGDALPRFVADLLAAEFAHARPGRPAPRLAAGAGFDLVRDLGADSLDLQALGTALAEALHLQDAGGAGRLLADTRLDAWIACARAALQDGAGGRMTFRTSGSSGAPKRCTHGLDTLRQECAELARLLPGRRRILGAVPAHHIYGFLFTVLLPAHLGGLEVVDVRAAAPAALAGMVRAGDLVVAHPGWWEAVQRVEPAFAPGIVGVTSAAPCPDPLAAALAAAGLRLLQVYGSSETAGVGWRDAAGAPYALLPYWRRSDDDAVLERELPDGGTGAYPLQDRLVWTGDGLFLPEGRRDDAVQVGGVNVFPAYVAEVLRMHPEVREAAVRPMRADEGARLKAYVVPRGVAEAGFDAEAFTRELAAFAAERLRAPERPAAYTFGARPARQASGKPADWIIDAV
jgi:long-chain acyl-CoA synthetase